MTKYDVTIVGGGIAGLTAAIYAAKAGKRTILLEQQQRLGGRAVTNKKNGIYFDLGGHALYKGEAYETFQELGLHLTVSTPSTEGYGIWKNQLLPLPTGLASFIQTRLLTWRGKVEFAKWFPKFATVETSKWNHISLRDWIEAEFQDPLLRNLFYGLLRTATYLAAPDLQAAGPAVRRLQNALKGVFYTDYGWGPIVEQLRQSAIQHGVRLETGVKINLIEHDNQTVQSVLTAEGDRIETTHVIVTTPPSIAHNMVVHADQTALETWKNQAIPITVACLDVGLRKLPMPKHQFVYGIDQPVFFSDQSRSGKPKPAIYADHGEHKVSLFKYQRQETNATEDREQLEQVLDLIQPGWRNELVAQQFLPKITVANDFPHLNRSSLPEPNVPEIQGLYVAGDWVAHEELLVDASVSSARRAVNHLLQLHLLTA